MKLCMYSTLVRLIVANVFFYHANEQGTKRTDRRVNSIYSHVIFVRLLGTEAECEIV